MPQQSKSDDIQVGAAPQIPDEQNFQLPSAPVENSSLSAVFLAPAAHASLIISAVYPPTLRIVTGY
jgi:hypothetical protein